MEVARPRLGQLLSLLRRQVERRAMIVQILGKLALLVPSSVLHLGPLRCGVMLLNLNSKKLVGQLNGHISFPFEDEKFISGLQPQSDFT